jgi:hypothetical protein
LYERTAEKASLPIVIFFAVGVIEPSPNNDIGVDKDIYTAR